MVFVEPRKKQTIFAQPNKHNEDRPLIVDATPKQNPQTSGGIFDMFVNQCKDLASAKLNQTPAYQQQQSPFAVFDQQKPQFEYRPIRKRGRPKVQNDYRPCY